MIAQEKPNGIPARAGTIQGMGGSLVLRAFPDCEQEGVWFNRSHLPCKPEETDWEEDAANHR